MNIMAWLIRAKRWAHNPPSPGQVKLVFGVIALCLVIVLAEKVFGWPDWLVLNRLDAKP
jgi:hypothetical protein